MQGFLVGSEFGKIRRLNSRTSEGIKSKIGKYLELYTTVKDIPTTWRDIILTEADRCLKLLKYAVERETFEKYRHAKDKFWVE